jgi:hypothetical protein
LVLLVNDSEYSDFTSQEPIQFYGCIYLVFLAWRERRSRRSEFFLFSTRSPGSIPPPKKKRKKKKEEKKKKKKRESKVPKRRKKASSAPGYIHWA